jgi:hypothetical protein
MSAVEMSRRELRNFHLSGKGLEAAIPPRPLRPVILENVRDLPALESSFPLCVQPDGHILPFRELVRELDHAPLITSAFRAAMADRASAPLSDIAPAAIASLPECGSSELARLRKLLKPEASLVAFHRDSVAILHGAILAAASNPFRRRFREKVTRSIARLRELLMLDQSHAPDAVSAESLAAAMGPGIRGFFNPSILAGALRRPSNPLKRMAVDRRARCEATLHTLEEGLEYMDGEPAFRLFSSADEARHSKDSFSDALDFCDARLARLSQVLRALRVTRLEMESAYDPTVHDEMLERFDWQAAEPEELRSLPPIVVLETAANVAQTSLTSFGRVLRSGRPIQILIAEPGLSTSGLNEFQPDIGYLAISHRESFVLATSLSQPSHLLEGLTRMAATLRPAVAIVSVPSAEAEDGDPWLESVLLMRSHAVPLYCYDPDAGVKWTERFHLESNGQPDSGLNAVHAAAVSGVLREQFRLIPADAWESEQLELAQYLEASNNQPPRAVPFIWVAESNGGHERAALTRSLVNFSIDRHRAWELFQELASAGKPQPPETSPDQARQEGANEALQRVLALLGQEPA